MLWLLATVVLLALRSDGHPSGAPNTSCSSMLPKHGVDPQPAPSPYSVTTQKRRVAAGTPLQLMVSSAAGVGFSGFLVHAVPSGGGEPVGEFTAIPSFAKSLSCGGDNLPTSVTHNNSSTKKSLEFEWTAPENYVGQVVFNGTILQDFSTFWANVHSDVVDVVKRSADDGAHSTGISTTKSPVITNKVVPAAGPQDPVYAGCGVTKNCLGHPSGCLDSRTCEIIVGVSKEDGRYIFEMKGGHGGAYVAVGISDDMIMGDDSVLECVHDPVENDVRAYMSWNSGKHNRRLKQSQDGITLLNSSLIDGAIYCKVTRSAVTEIENIQFDLEHRKYHLMVASGRSLNDKGDGVGYHSIGRAVASKRTFVAEPSGSHFTSTSTTEAPTTTVNTQDPLYKDCNVKKNCFGTPEGCVDSGNCLIIVTVLVEAERYVFEMQGLNSAYVAVGLSDDNKMGGDSVVECAHDGTGKNNVNSYMSWNIVGKTSNQRLQRPHTGITLLNGSHVDGNTYCKFIRDSVTTVEGVEFDLVNKKYYLLIASGSGLKANQSNVGFHDVAKAASGESNFLAEIKDYKEASKLFIYLHGSFMVAAWIGSASVGILLARYFKQTWVDSQLCGKDMWFAFHRMFMVLTWSLTIAGFVIIFLEIRAWSTATVHAVLGCVTTGLAFIQPLGAAFRPHPGSRRRPLFNWLHWLVGNMAHIMAIVTIFFATKLQKAELPGWTDWILVGYVAFHVIMHLTLSISGCASECLSGKRVNTFPMKEMSSSRSPLHPERKRDQPLSCFRKFLLGVYFLGIIAVTAALIVIIVLAPIETKWKNVQKVFSSQ